MFTDPALTLAGQLFWMVDLFCKTMAAEACRLRIGTLSIAVWSRVKRFERRFSALYARWKAGKLPPPRGPSPAPPPKVAAGENPPASAPAELLPSDVARLRPASLLPRAFAWLHKLLPMSAPQLTGGLKSLIQNHPEIQAFVAAAPAAGRILRPFCRMVGLKPPEWLALPKRKRVRKKKPPLPPHPDAAYFPDTPAARSAARALACAQAGLPVDVKKLSAVAYGYILHPRPGGFAPPNEIGYGGRVRWLPVRARRDSKNRD